MKKTFVLAALLLSVICAKAQNTTPNNSVALEVAKATLKAHGGEKLNQAKNMVLKGTAEVTAPGTNQALPVGFVIVVAGEKYRFEFQSAILNFKQVSDGINTTSSLAGVSLPPMNRVGLFVLPKIEETGFAVTALPEKFKKRKDFELLLPRGITRILLLMKKLHWLKNMNQAI